MSEITVVEQMVFKKFFHAVLHGSIDDVKTIISENGSKAFLEQNVAGFLVNASLQDVPKGTADNYKSGGGTAKIISASCGVCAVLCSIYKNRPEVAEYLFSLSVNPNTRIDDTWNDTLFLKSVAYGRVEIIKIMLSFGADVSLRDKDGADALLKCCPCYTSRWDDITVNERFVIMEILLQNGSNPNSKMEGVHNLSPFEKICYWMRGVRLICIDPDKKIKEMQDFIFDKEGSPISKFIELLVDYGASRTHNAIFAFNHSLDMAKQAAVEEANEKNNWLARVSKSAERIDEFFRRLF